MIMETNKFNGAKYDDWLRNLSIVLDFENQVYVLDKLLPTALPKGASSKERVTFKKCLEDNRKVHHIILSSMTNDIQKQYDRLDDIPLIMLRIKELYVISDRQYAAIEAFFKTKMAEGSSVHGHGIKMLSLVEKLEDLKVRFNNDTYIDVILQSLPLSYDPFIVKYMNVLEKSINELINMLVQYEATTDNSVPAVLVGEASIQDKRQESRMLEEDEGKGKGCRSHC
ncbi:UNVERIFIED_CONTAM: hypothetical protein Sradi_2354500 [Sesamum radiatum]|uniref:Uncharacterized protein n=1 Tax=Sesamum radiatum TaxID=300843 RepID=A0AAW2T665_SESRA